MRKRAISLGILLALTALVASPGSASHVIPGPPTTTLGVQPVGIHGNPTCSTLLASGDFLFEFKHEPAEDADNIPLSFNGQSGQLDVDTYQTPDGPAVDFDVSGAFVAATVVVKGGPNANHYDYRPDGALGALNIFGDPGLGDTFLHSPVNPKNEKFYGLSHISFCFTEAPAELEIEKTPDGGTITGGEDAEFTITVTSVGAVTAQDVVIDDELPAGFVWSIVAEDVAGACSIPGGTTLHCDVGNLAPSSSFSVTVSAPTSGGEGGDCGALIANPASTAEAINADQVTDEGDITVLCPDINVEKSGNGTINVGTDAVFSITVTNLGPGTATDVDLTDDLPDAGLAWSVTTQPAQGLCEIVAGNLDCDLGDMSEGQVLTIEVSAPTDTGDCRDIVNFAEVSATNEDPSRLGNNSDQDTITILCPDVVVEKSGNGTINEGTAAVYTITVTNLGPGTATEVDLTDDLPDAGLAWSVTTQPAQGSCAIAGGDLDCDLGDMSEGQVLTIDVSTPTDSEDCGDIDNFAEVSASNEDPAKTGNNTASDTITILCGAIQITKTAKHADASGATSPNLIATFEVVDEEGNSHTLVTDANGSACADGVALGTTQSITESDVPTGYAAPSIGDVKVMAGECADATLDSGGVVVEVENIPLTDLLVEVVSQVAGGTFSEITCVDDGDSSTIGADSGFSASVDTDDLVPGTYICTIVIDP